MATASAPSSLTLIELLKKYNSNTFPVSNFSLDNLDEEPQDSSVTSDQIARHKPGEYAAIPADTVMNVIDGSPPFTRGTSYFSMFLDGCRRSYYLCDMCTPSGAMLPIIAGQVSAAVVRRDRATGRVSLDRYIKRGLLLIPAGGNALNTADAEEIVASIDKAFLSDGITGKRIEIKHNDNPKNDALAHLNMEMQKLEVQFLDQLALSGEIDQNNMIIVDGALQFREAKAHLNPLRCAVGLSKRFNLHLTQVLPRSQQEIGGHLIKLRKVGDRTVAFRLHVEGGADYAFWYLRLRPRERLGFPFAGIVKLEKILVTEREQTEGLPSDTVNNISRCILLERTVCPYGLDFRWASHIYPIYLTEQIQKKKFTTDFVYSALLQRKMKI